MTTDCGSFPITFLPILMNIRILSCAALVSGLFFLQGASMLLAQNIVVAKIFNDASINGKTDSIELLVTKRNLDMRGMIIRDFTPELNDLASGGYRFSNDTLWANVSSGTIIVLSVGPSPLKRTTWTIAVGLSAGQYFGTLSTSPFNIASQDMVMIKSADAAFSGIGGNIHALAVAITSATIGQVSPSFRSARLPVLTSATPYALALLQYPNPVYTGDGMDFVVITPTSGTGQAGYTPVQFGLPHSLGYSELLKFLRGLSTSVARVVAQNESLSVYPNPAQERVTVRLGNVPSSGIVTIAVVSMLGIPVGTESVSVVKGSSEFEYSCAYLPQGAYILEVRERNGSVLSRCSFMKMK
jgi:Secretion system C-terminal sorting domain